MTKKRKKQPKEESSSQEFRDCETYLQQFPNYEAFDFDPEADDDEEDEGLPQDDVVHPLAHLAGKPISIADHIQPKTVADGSLSGSDLGLEIVKDSKKPGGSVRSGDEGTAAPQPRGSGRHSRRETR